MNNKAQQMSKKQAARRPRARRLNRFAAWATVREVSEVTGIPEQTVYYWLRTHQIKRATQIGGKHLIPRKWLQEIEAKLDSAPVDFDLPNMNFEINIEDIL